jgi:hypothetical protein
MTILSSGQVFLHKQSQHVNDMSEVTHPQNTYLANGKTAEPKNGLALVQWINGLHRLLLLRRQGKGCR